MKKVMKKVMCALLVVGIVLTSSVMAFAATAGDVNSDGKVNSTDALAILKYAVGTTPSKFDKSVADVNADGKINSTDALKVLQITVGIGSGEMSKADIVKLYNDGIKKSYEQNKCTLVISIDGTGTVNEFLMNGEENSMFEGILENALKTEYEDQKYTFYKGKTLKGEKAEDILADIGLTADEIKNATAVKYGNGYKLTFNLYSRTSSLDDLFDDLTGVVQFEYCTVEFPNTQIVAVTDAQGRITSIEICAPGNMKASTKGGEAQMYMDVSLTQMNTYKFSY